MFAVFAKYISWNVQCKMCIFGLISGQKDVLKKRLKSYFKRKYIIRPGIGGSKESHYSYYIVIDFEATCDENSHNYPHEIIEFPAVLVNAADGSVVSILYSSVRLKLFYFMCFCAMCVIHHIL